MKEPTGILAEANQVLQSVQAAQQEAAIKNAAIREAERTAKMAAWQDKETMTLRHALHNKGAIESLWCLRESGQCTVESNMPIPPQEELPKSLRGQAPSYVRSMLRGNKEWEQKVKDHQKAEEEKHGLRGKHPELFGINFSKVRQDNPVTLGDEHKVRTGKHLIVKTAEGKIAAAPAPEAYYEPSAPKKRWKQRLSDWFEAIK
jgi:hypothetical protein